jgi:hypothetical protein
MQPSVKYVPRRLCTLHSTFFLKHLVRACIWRPTGRHWLLNKAVRESHRLTLLVTLGTGRLFTVVDASYRLHITEIDEPYEPIPCTQKGSEWTSITIFPVTASKPFRHLAAGTYTQPKEAMFLPT